jgi:membrane protein YqaA with SNARE-associated domain
MIAVAILISSILILILLQRAVMPGLIFKFSQSILARNLGFAKYWLFINGMIASFAPVPTELSITAALLFGMNQAHVMVILDAGSVIGAIIAYCVGFKGAYYIGKISSRAVRIDEAFVRLRNFLQKYMWFVILISP